MLCLCLQHDEYLRLDPLVQRFFCGYKYPPGSGQAPGCRYRCRYCPYSHHKGSKEVLVSHLLSHCQARSDSGVPVPLPSELAEAAPALLNARKDCSAVRKRARSKGSSNTAL